MKKFSIQEAVKFGWATFKKYPVLLISVVLITGIASYLPGMLYNGATDNGQDPNWLLYFIIMIPAYIIQLILSMGVIRIALDLVDGKKPELSDIISQYPKTLNYLIASVLYGTMVVAGLILLVIPGIYLAIKYQFYSYLIVDKNLGALDAIKQSGKITQGNIWNLFLFNVAAIVLIILGAIAFLVGLLVAVPVVMVAGAFVYSKLSR